MNYLDFTIQINNKKYDDFDKLSHKNKSLKKHIQETFRISKFLLNFYDLNSLSEKVVEYLCFCHDLGKLKKDWKIDNLKKNPPHSEESVRIILNDLLLTHKFKEKKEYQLILLYLITKHHGILKLTPFEIDNYSFDFINDLKNLSFEEKISLVDSFGIFKLSDFISANSQRERDIIRKTKQITKKIKISSDEIKFKLNLIDEKRWQQQLKLSNCGDIALLQAPTGWGKTTTSLIFSVNKNWKRIFYLLPTITAIRDFKKKLEKVVGKENIEAYFYFYDVEKITYEGIDLETLWLCESFLKPVIITTIDQFLLTFLQVGKYHLKRVNFRNAIFIIDEIHLFSPLMLKLFLHFFNKFRVIYKLKLLIMSATLTDALVSILCKELKIAKKDYFNFNTELSKKLRVRFGYKKEDITKIIPEIISEFRKKKKVLVIVNTVDKAINLGKRLAEDYKINQVIVFHSRFIYKHRLEKEKEILEKCKKTHHILVTTQIAEISLDISYDFLFTEVAPFSSLVQRFGRVNRYGREKVDNINCLILYPNEIDNAKRYPYEIYGFAAIELIESLNDTEVKSEQEIYDRINKLDNEFFLKETIKNADKNHGFHFKIWEEKFNYFYALSLDEETLKQVLNYREGFTILALLDSSMVESKSLAEEIRVFLETRELNKKDFQQRRLLIAKAKELSIPVPYYLAKQSKEDGGFPILKLDGFSYNYQYGLYKIGIRERLI